MDIGCHLPTQGPVATREALLTFAQEAERRNVASLWVSDHVVVRWRSSGTHNGPLAQIPATGRKASNHGCSVMELKKAKITHAWVYFDNAHLLRQLGVLPA